MQIPHVVKFTRLLNRCTTDAPNRCKHNSLGARIGGLTTVLVHRFGAPVTLTTRFGAPVTLTTRGIRNIMLYIFWAMGNATSEKHELSV